MTTNNSINANSSTPLPLVDGGTGQTGIITTSWTPTFTFATPGNLSVSYSVRSGFYAQAGNLIHATFSITFTPTFTTASGVAAITGLPVAANASVSDFYAVAALLGAGQSWGTGTQVCLTLPGSATSMNMLVTGSTQAGGLLTTAQFTSGDSIQINGTIAYTT